VLVSGGRLAGVIDVGGLGPADPALDLVAAYADVSESCLRILMRRSASPFVISNAVRGTCLSTSTRHLDESLPTLYRS
jgi:aminoglycoside phosphotransferase (APT) family kinase protein